MGRRFVLWPLVMSLATGFVLSASAPASAYGRSSVQVDIGFFYDDLEPYGDWVEVNDYGHCWRPSVSYASWRPYSRGHWAWTDDYGWFWASDEPFGWATYHYGRWYLDPYYGWVWVPGYEWGPSWVSWRYGGGYVGWAPLPPRVSWSAGFGFRLGGAQFDTYISPRSYSFVEERAFVDTGVYRRVLPVERNTVIIRATENVTDYSAVGDRVVAHGPRPERIERVAGRRVPRPRVMEVNSVQEVRRAHRRDAVPVFRPEVRPSDAVPRHLRAERRGLREPQREAQVQQQERRNIERQHRVEQQEANRQRQQEERQAQRQRRQEQIDQRQIEQQEARRRQRDEQARQNMERRQARERQEVEQRHQEQLRNRRDLAEVQRSQREEHRAMQEQQRSERQQLGEQARQERQAAREQRAQQAEASRQQARQERQEARGERQQQAERRAQPRKEQAAQKKERDRDKGNDRPDKNR